MKRQFVFLAILSVAAACAAGREEVLISDLSAPAARGGWNTLAYETVDGIKGTMLYAPWGRKERLRAEIPLPCRGKYRIMLGMAGAR